MVRCVACGLVVLAFVVGCGDDDGGADAGDELGVVDGGTSDDRASVDGAFIDMATTDALGDTRVDGPELDGNLPDVSMGDGAMPDGGPDGASVRDRDGDGVIDEDDSFPDDPGEFIDPDEDGIGAFADIDEDNDGVPDELDAAPLDDTRTELNVADEAEFNDGAATPADGPFPIAPGKNTVCWSIFSS
ncbi:MAG: hypothetical protein AAF411_08950 [Myxococcota bacterium]